MEISVVIPAYNEAKNVAVMHQKLVEVLTKLGVSFELIFGNDGSVDDTEAHLTSLHVQDSRVKIVSLSRNFGHQAALSAGLRHAQGDAVISMDGDLQHPPELIPEMLRLWREGYEVVYTKRKDTKDGGAFKRATSRLFYTLFNKLVRTPIPRGAADFRLLDRKVVDVINALGENARFLRGMVHWVGFQQVSIEYVAAARHAGTSSYPLRRMLSFALTGITSFSSFPLRISFYIGLIVLCLSIVYTLYSIGIWAVSGKAIPGWTSLMVVVLTIGGVQMMVLGVIGEYLGRVFDQVKNRPPYIVGKTIGEMKEDKF